MSKTMRAVLGIAVFAIIVGGGIGAMIHYSSPYNTSVNIWLPENHSIGNLVDGAYVPINFIKPSGTLVHIPFEAYERRFADKEGSIIVAQDGTACFIAKVGNIAYVTYLYYIADKGRSFFKEREVYTLNSEGTLGIHHYRSWVAIYIGGTFLLIAGIIAGGLIACPPNKKTPAPSAA